MLNIAALWEQLVECICRPPRDEYELKDLIGGVRGFFSISNCRGARTDIELLNKKGQKLQCSHYIPSNAKGRDGRLPCVIYCHCNSGSRRDSEEAVAVLLPLGVSVFAVDFAGSGLSEGGYVSLGANEVDDVEIVVAHLRALGTVSTLGLWGRSMGAVTALLYSRRDPSIAGIVLDSPFAKLTELMLEIVQSQKIIPQAFARLALGAMRRSVRKRACFDINTLNPIELVGESFTPALFGHAIADHFVQISHSERLHAGYAGDKNFIKCDGHMLMVCASSNITHQLKGSIFHSTVKFEGDHNSARPSFFYNSVGIFFHNTLQLESLTIPSSNTPRHRETSVAATSSRTSHRPTPGPSSQRPSPSSKTVPSLSLPIVTAAPSTTSSSLSTLPGINLPSPGQLSDRGKSHRGGGSTSAAAAADEEDDEMGLQEQKQIWQAALHEGNAEHQEGEPDTEEEADDQLLLALRLSMMDLQQGSHSQHGAQAELPGHLIRDAAHEPPAGADLMLPISTGGASPPHIPSSRAQALTSATKAAFTKTIATTQALLGLHQSPHSLSPASPHPPTSPHQPSSSRAPSLSSQSPTSASQTSPSRTAPPSPISITAPFSLLFPSSHTSPGSSPHSPAHTAPTATAGVIGFAGLEQSLLERHEFSAGHAGRAHGVNAFQEMTPKSRDDEDEMLARALAISMQG